MKMFSNLNARLKAYREEHMGENGFSLLELVVAVGVLLALSVGGFLAYSGITENAKSSAVQSAASTVFSAAAAYEADGDSSTDAAKAATEFNLSTSDIKVTAAGTGTATDPIIVQAWNTDKATDYASQANAKLKADRSSNTVATP